MSDTSSQPSVVEEVSGSSVCAKPTKPRRTRKPSRPLPEVGTLVRGSVESITPEGSAILRLGGGRFAWLPASEYSWVEPWVDLSKRLKVDRFVDAVVTHVRANDDGQAQIRVSHRLTRPNPWETIDREHSIGERIFAKIVILGKRYALVELETGYPAKLSQRELSWSRQTQLTSDVLEIGSWIEVVIQSIDAPARRIEVSRRAALPNPWSTIEQTLAIGTQATAVVESCATFGVFARLKDELTGLIHVSRLRDEVRNYQPGMQLRVQVVGINTEEQKIALEELPGTESIASESLHMAA